MTIHNVCYDDVLKYTWDTVTQVLTEFNKAGQIIKTRPMTQNELDKFAQDEAAMQAAGNESTIRSNITTALTNNATYLGRANPSVAQNTAQIQALTRQINGLMRLVDKRLDTLSGT